MDPDYSIQRSKVKLEQSEDKDGHTTRWLSNAWEKKMRDLWTGRKIRKKMIQLDTHMQWCWNKTRSKLKDKKNCLLLLDSRQKKKKKKKKLDSN